MECACEIYITQRSWQRAPGVLALPPYHKSAVFKQAGRNHGKEVKMQQTIAMSGTLIAWPLEHSLLGCELQGFRLYVRWNCKLCSWTHSSLLTPLLSQGSVLSLRIFISKSKLCSKTDSIITAVRPFGRSKSSARCPGRYCQSAWELSAHCWAPYLAPGLPVHTKPGIQRLCRSSQNCIDFSRWDSTQARCPYGCRDDWSMPPQCSTKWHMCKARYSGDVDGTHSCIWPLRGLIKAGTCGESGLYHNKLNEERWSVQSRAFCWYRWHIHACCSEPRELIRVGTNKKYSKELYQYAVLDTVDKLVSQVCWRGHESTPCHAVVPHGCQLLHGILVHWEQRQPPLLLCVGLVSLPQCQHSLLLPVHLHTGTQQWHQWWPPFIQGPCHSLQTCANAMALRCAAPTRINTVVSQNMLPQTLSTAAITFFLSHPGHQSSQVSDRSSLIDIMVGGIKTSAPGRWWGCVPGSWRGSPLQRIGCRATAWSPAAAPARSCQSACIGQQHFRSSPFGTKRSWWHRLNAKEDANP